MHLLRSPLVRPIDAPFGRLLDDLARARGWPTSGDGARLGALARKLSDAYNGPSAAPRSTDESLAARLGFSFARDVPKGAAAIREVVASGAVVVPASRDLRVLDVGAGLGATSRGVVRALASAGARGRVVVDAVDVDGAALELAVAIARARPREGEVEIELRATRSRVDPRAATAGPYDVVLLGQVLSELDRDAGADRVARHAALVRGYASVLGPGGVVVIVEPALRERTRHLHAVRDAVVLEGARPALAVLAPCQHDMACPMLETEDGWCHEDVDVDLPEWLVPTARAAGLRWQGLTFSYLVLAREVPSEARARGALRVVSSPIVTKGKRELFLCGLFDGSGEASKVRGMRLDRNASETNAAWGEAARGDVLVALPALSRERPRVQRETIVTRDARGR